MQKQKGGDNTVDSNHRPLIPVPSAVRTNQWRRMEAMDRETDETGKAEDFVHSNSLRGMEPAIP